MDGDEWVINGQKVGDIAGALGAVVFVLWWRAPKRALSATKGCRIAGARSTSTGFEGVRPIVQLTGDSEFNEVFFDDARNDADLVVGSPG